jgi:hypothetical protein
LLDQGIRHLTIWECTVRGPGRLQSSELVERVREWLMSGALWGEVSGSKIS